MKYPLNIHKYVHVDWHLPSFPIFIRLRQFAAHQLPGDPAHLRFGGWLPGLVNVYRYCELENHHFS